MRDAGLTAEEALLAVTAESAAAIGVPDVGRIARGAHADLAAYDLDDPRALTYPLGDLHARTVWLGGRAVVRAAAVALW